MNTKNCPKRSTNSVKRFIFSFLKCKDKPSPGALRILKLCYFNRLNDTFEALIYTEQGDCVRRTNINQLECLI